MPRFTRPLRALIAALGVITVVGAFAGPANAVSYTDQPICSVSDQTPSEGGQFTLSGKGFGANEDIKNVLHSDPVTLAPAVADASGSFAVTISLPAGVTGVHTITSTGARTGRTTSVTITIGGASTTGTTSTAAAPSSGVLAFTGAAITGIIGLAALLLAGGGLMLFSSRRRKSVS